MNKQYLILLCLLILLIAGCNTEAESQILSKNGENNEMENSESQNIPIGEREEDAERATGVDFDWWNTIAVLQPAFEEVIDTRYDTTDAGFAAEAAAGDLRRAGVRGAVRAEVTDQGSGYAPLFVIESEDNRLYQLILTGNYVCAIRDIETEELIYYEIE